MRTPALFILTFSCFIYPAKLLAQDGTADSTSSSATTPPGRVIAKKQKAKRPDRNSSIYYKNKLEFSLETGWLPIDIPFVYDVFVGDNYNVTGVNYTMVPTLASLRWQMGDISGPWIFRGNFDVTFSGAFTWIPRGPETNYEAFDIGVRRNFVLRNSKFAPYFDMRGGVGRIDAKGPEGVYGAQGQDPHIHLYDGQRRALQLQLALRNFGGHQLHARFERVSIRAPLPELRDQRLRPHVRA